MGWGGFRIIQIPGIMIIRKKEGGQIERQKVKGYGYPFGGKNLKSKQLFYVPLGLVLILCGLLIFHQPILKGAGRFLAPTGDEAAEVLILEGTQVVENGALDAGMKLLSNGRANRMVVVLQKPLKEGQVFALQGKYTQLIINELEHLGLEKGRVQVISAPIDGHPVTLSEARFVVGKLSQNGVRSAILLSKGFHTRRSFGVYSQEGNRVGLHVGPSSYFTEYETNSWWYDAQGISDFVVESLKLAYYVLHGYVSIKSLWY
jgi:hypothetical protein